MLKFTQCYPKLRSCVPYWEFMIIKRCKHRKDLKKYYQTLEVAEDCEDETLRLAFVYQVKKFHPDSGTSEANAAKFTEIEHAYRQIRKARMEDRENSKHLPEVEEFDIKHTAPQHRHYLVYNVGIGTHNKRQKLYTIERAQKAVDNVLEHRLKKLQAEERNSLIGIDKQRAKDIKTRFGMDRLVEDLIQEAMNRGEFKDLKGMGKPLKENTNTRNPYVDYVTYKLNEVLIENGFIPEWIQLSKEINEDTENLRKQLTKARNNIGLLPLSYTDERTWKNTIEDLKSTTKRINSKIDKYNLLVPILQKQKLHIKLDDLANEALSVPPRKNVVENNSKNRDTDFSVNKEPDLFQTIFSIFGK
ncbi:dnaJ homolog subfamily C member 28 [Ceratina calcarata]|uniref:DnaJ homolog subfamily C member 28 n=1 Tax=Ceratina calcarata TaxID=156304 RepID=A0AAJ7S871_9HYME|nr:dnaJ homolog subfamily C member 28 [Ceratina calcarata]XP_026672394.1 dnaJ homolog subfamily C member 28 [Ceratina calcarata]XP_026672395.1 dnaJ homolog subfamily C member 28 [Ceratina calcarata]